MKLFLSSYRFGANPDELLQLVGEADEVMVITNAKDYKPHEERTQSVRELFDSFNEINITPRELDLRSYFNKPGVEDILSVSKFVWLAGGNTFVLRRALKLSGADKALAKLVYEGKLIYGGESAGAVIATPTLRGVEFGDDPYILPEGYADEELWDGLHFVPYAIVPHYESEWEGYERMMDVLEEENIPYKTLNNAQTIVINDESTT